MAADWDGLSDILNDFKQFTKTCKKPTKHFFIIFFPFKNKKQRKQRITEK